MLNHEIVRARNNPNGFEFKRCDFCGRASMDDHWLDDQCNVIVCDSCRSQVMKF